MKWLFLAAFLFTNATLKGQVINKRFVDSCVANFYPRLKNGHIVEYHIVNGDYFAAVDSIKLDSALKGLFYKYLLCIDAYSGEELLQTAGIPGKILVFIEKKGWQTKKQIRKLIPKAIEYYAPANTLDHPKTDSTDPVLFINGKQILFSECYKEIVKIRRRNVYAIDLYKLPTSEAYFGQYAKNGVVTIWVKR